ncbi:MAG: SDR family oxidoreductase [Gammaproteobacteria bacterium]|nr:SDR family oxidoreductase [Gammaproteobacteria bacterium]
MTSFRLTGALAAAAIAALMLLAGCAMGAGESTGNTSGTRGVALVAGATGGTGRALVRNLREQGYQVRALVRDADGARQVLGDAVDIRQGDVRELDTLLPAMAGVDYVISAIGASQSDPENGPEAVDYGGVKNLTEAARRSGVRQFVLVSSAGATQEDHYLNKMFNNILRWKFKGEEALRNSGLTYTVVRPGGLVNIPGGEQRLVFAQGDTTNGRISREDVALICIQALQEPAARNKTFETYSSEEPGSNDWPAMFAALEQD